MSFIALENVTKQYNGTAGIRDVSLEVEQGSFVSIVGPFGSGKTTLLRIIAGLISDYEGKATIGDMTPKETKVARRIGVGFQQPTLLSWRNVIDNISLPIEIVKPSVYTEPDELLELAGLASIKERNIHELSGGTRQLVSILRSLVLSPDVLLLDEPFSSIDEMTKDKMHEKLLAIHRQRKQTTILVTHSLQEAVYLSDKVVVLSAAPGRVKSIIDIDFARDSIEAKYSPEALEYVRQLRAEIYS